MKSGLDINLEAFKKMRSIDRDILMYNNLVHIRKKVCSYRFHKKIHYVWLGILTIFVGLKKYISL